MLARDESECCTGLAKVGFLGFAFLDLKKNRQSGSVQSSGLGF